MCLCLCSNDYRTELDLYPAERGVTLLLYGLPQEEDDVVKRSIFFWLPEDFLGLVWGMNGGSNQHDRWLLLLQTCRVSKFGNINFC